MRYIVESFGQDCLGNITGYRVVDDSAPFVGGMRTTPPLATFCGNIYEPGSFQAAKAKAEELAATLNDGGKSLHDAAKSVLAMLAQYIELRESGKRPDIKAGDAVIDPWMQVPLPFSDKQFVAVARLMAAAPGWQALIERGSKAFNGDLAEEPKGATHKQFHLYYDADQIERDIVQ